MPYILLLQFYCPNLKLFDISNNLLTDDILMFLVRGFGNRKQKLHTINLSNNQFTAKAMGHLLFSDVCQKLEIEDNRVGLHVLA